MLSGSVALAAATFEATKPSSTMIRHLLVPTDFSACANNATKVALEIAQRINAEVHFMHAMELNWQSIDMLAPNEVALADPANQDVYPQVAKQAADSRSQLDALVQQAQDAGIKATSEVVYNQPGTYISTYANGRDDAMIVMGSHGASGFREAFIGSNAQKVVRTAPCPVLTIKSGQESLVGCNMVYASDFEENSINDNLPRVADLANLLGAKLHLLYVNTPYFFEATDHSVAKINKAVEIYKLENTTVNTLSHYSAEDGILAFADSVNAGLISITVHGYQGLRRLFRNNITETLVNHSNIPVLSLNIPA